MPRKRLPMRELAALRIIALAEEIGRDDGFAHGWKARVARELGLTYQTAWEICSDKKTSVGLTVIEQVCKHVGISIKELCEG